MKNQKNYSRCQGCIRYFSVTVAKHPGRDTLQEEKFILDLGQRIMEARGRQNITLHDHILNHKQKEPQLE